MNFININKIFVVANYPIESNRVSNYILNYFQVSLHSKHAARVYPWKISKIYSSRDDYNYIVLRAIVICLITYSATYSDTISNRK